MYDTCNETYDPQVNWIFKNVCDKDMYMVHVTKHMTINI